MKLSDIANNTYISIMLWLAKISKSKFVMNKLEKYTAEQINELKQQVQKDNWTLAMLQKEQYRQQSR